MAKYVIYEAAYVRGYHLGKSATRLNPVEIELPNDVVPSVTWDPADEAALTAVNKMVAEKVQAALKGVTDTTKAKVIKETIEKKYLKAKVRLEEPAKPAVREMTTNAEIASAPRNVVGRMSDKSPV